MDRITASDAELVEASRRGERAAFGELVARYQRVVCAVGYCSTNDRSLGEDVAQDTFVAAFHQLDQLRDVSRLRSWLCGIARNLARKAKRARDREDEIDEAQPDSAASPFDAASERERDVVVGKALARVPETYREALVLFYVEQRSVTAVADALGISADAVHQRLSRGRQLVAAEVAELVEHTLERRRTRRNLVAGVLAALPASVIPAHAHAANASGGSSMLKIGIAAALTATIAGTGYAVHRARAEHTATSSSSIAAAASSGLVPTRPAASLPWARRAHASHSVTAPPALPSATGHVVNDCGAVARHLGSLMPQMVSSTTSIAMTRDQVEKLRAALGSGQMYIVEGSGALPTGEAAKLEFGTDLEQQCKDEHWPQSLIDCLASVPDMFATAECSTGAPPGIAGPTAAQLAAITDIGCKAVAAHVAATITVKIPLVDGVPATVAASVREANRVIEEMNDHTDGIADQIAATCDDDAWAESLRRCLAASTSPEMMATCH
jgi:RNA polymerase sigma factor (sigma-70 family)